MSVIFVTGGAGFIGSAFVRMVLERKPDVKVVNFDALTYAGNLENLAGLVPKLSALDLSLIMADDNLAPRLEMFFASHRELVSPSFSDYLVIGAIIAFPIVVFLALVLAGQL